MGDGEEPLRWRRVPRVLGLGPAVGRLRCGGCVPAGRRPALAGRRCPAWALGPGLPPAAGPGQDWG
eukprot:4724637-Lingulodinium_polyedra.AAC.1